MQPPSVVVFDLGKVLVDFDYSIAARKLGPRTKMPPPDLYHLLCHSPLLIQYETGVVNTEEFFRQVRAMAGLDMELEEFSQSFGSIFSEIPQMIQMQAALRAAGIPTWIFSNTSEIAVRHVRENFPFFANFNGYVLSYEHGAMKPDPRIYEVIERQTGHSGPAVLYLDDRPENVAAGRARGWRAWLHETPEKSVAHLGSLGLPVG